MFFVIGFFLTIASYQFFENYWSFLNHSLFFQGKPDFWHDNYLKMTICKIKYRVQYLMYCSQCNKDSNPHENFVRLANRYSINYNTGDIPVQYSTTEINIFIVSDCLFFSPCINFNLVENNFRHRKMNYRFWFREYRILKSISPINFTTSSSFLNAKIKLFLY